MTEVKNAIKLSEKLSKVLDERFAEIKKNNEEWTDAEVEFEVESEVAEFVKNYVFKTNCTSDK